MKDQTNPPQNKTGLGFKGNMLLLLAAIFVAIAVWIVFINLPRPEYPVSQDSAPNDTTVSNPDDAAEPTEPLLPFDVSVVYSPGYLIELGGLEKMHPFDIRKYEKIHQGLIKDELLTQEQTIKPAPVTREELLLVHTPKYLDELSKRAKVAEYLEAPVLQYAPISLEQAVLQPFRRASGGTIRAAREALKSGIGVNLGGGYHHAKPDRGEGFCLYADVPIAIRKLQSEKLISRAIVIDVDVHQGNGTIVCLPDDDSTFTFSMHQGNIYPIPKENGDLDVELGSGMQDEEYLEILAENLPKILDDADADICFIVGGCDPLDGDPLAGLKMTHAGIAKRDHAIVEACVERNLPVVLTLSGGYSPDAWKSQYLSIKNLIEVYGLSNQSDQELPSP